jgi:uncharacterized protein YbjT (DUF2867 family)
MKPRILLTGATGYVGGRLLRKLEAGKHSLRCVARRPEYLYSRVGPQTEVVPGDLLDGDSIERALDGIDIAYYLVHSMGSSKGFERTDREAAHNFGAAARNRKIRRIVYLGGLGDASVELSPHLRSRHEVGDVLRQYGVPVTEFRASVILGSGSLSFEMIRTLTERLPVLITPRWVQVLTQPIAVEDVLQYLIEALDNPMEGSAVFEIGGPDKISYGGLMREYARQRGLRRIMISVPVLTPRISSLWLGLVTPLYARIGRKLIDGIRHPTIVRDETALNAFWVRPVGASEAIARALRNEDHEFAVTRWSDALSSSGSFPRWGGFRFGNRLIDSRKVFVGVPPAAAFAPIQRIGGSTGWYFGNSLWKIRGLIDLLAGGVGMNRGRPGGVDLKVGDTVDCWRVEAFETDRELRLMAEMKLPGRAWLGFEVSRDGNGSCIRQTAEFDPVGLEGLLYWYVMYPMHHLVFSGMLRGIARSVETWRQK